METNETITLPINDIIPPGGIGLWPPAPGWWLLLCALILLVFVGKRYHKRHRQHWSYRKAALKELKRINEYSNAENISQSATEIMSILKRACKTCYQEQQFSQLEGKRFLLFANSVMPQTVFSDAIINNIDTVLYNQQTNIDIGAFYKQACQWVKQHPAQLTHSKHAVDHV